MNPFENKTVLITGGASGIGKILCRLFLESKSTVIIWDINTEMMEKTKNELSHLGSIHCFQVDISQKSEIIETAKLVEEKIGIVDVLINNAGIIVGKFFHEHTQADIEKTMEINAYAPMFITHAFLNGMIQKNDGYICNIASSAGLISNPKMSVYAASKWSLSGWSDSLRLEMIELKKNISVTTIMPYYINTGMFDGVKSKLIPIQDPEHVALKIFKSISKRKNFVTIPGFIYHLTRLSQGIFSTRVFDWVMRYVFGIYKTMEHFTGRKK